VCRRYARVYLDCDLTVTGDPQFTVLGDSGGTILHYVSIYIATLIIIISYNGNFMHVYRCFV